jgi:ABC-type multidrug transport system permease subunit
MPVAMTFVLILGIPTAGGSVPPDMLPAALGTLHQVLPFGQFIDLARSTAYFGGHDAVGPFLTLLGWAFAAATLFAFAARRAKRPVPSPGT